MCGFGSASSLYPRVLINCFPVHCGHFFLDSTGIYWSSTIVYASATIHQSRLQVTNVGDKSPTPATSHRSLLQFTNVGYNSPTSATTHQSRLQLTNVSHQSPMSSQKKPSHFVGWFQQSYNCFTIVLSLGSLSILREQHISWSKNLPRATTRSYNATPGHMSRENDNSKRYMQPSVRSSTMYKSQDSEATYMFINRGVDKEDAAHHIQWSIAQP